MMPWYIQEQIIFYNQLPEAVMYEVVCLPPVRNDLPGPNKIT